MITTTLGTCDICGEKKAEIIVSMPEPETSHAFRLDVCEKCAKENGWRDEELGIGLS